MTDPYRRIEPDLHLNDPERAFSFASQAGGALELSFVDWRNRTVAFRFENVHLFHHQFGGGYRNLPEGEVVELHDSGTLLDLREAGTVEPQEAVRHIVISTNEGEWCEIVAARYEVRVTG